MRSILKHNCESTKGALSIIQSRLRSKAPVHRPTVGVVYWWYTTVLLPSPPQHLDFLHVDRLSPKLPLFELEINLSAMRANAATKMKPCRPSATGKAVMIFSCILGSEYLETGRLTRIRIREHHIKGGVTWNIKWAYRGGLLLLGPRHDQQRLNRVNY